MPIGKCAVRLDLATGKVWLQSYETLGSTKAERSRLLVDHLLQSMNSKLWARVAHVVHGKDPHDRPSYYKLVKFAVQKEAESTSMRPRRCEAQTQSLRPLPTFTMNAVNLPCLPPQLFTW